MGSKHKEDTDSNVERYKTRPVACRNEQLIRVDDTLKFAWILQIIIVKFIMVLSRCWNMSARHGDILSAYVKSDKVKDLDIYMIVSSGVQVGQDVWTNTCSIIREKSVKMFHTKTELSIRETLLYY